MSEIVEVESELMVDSKFKCICIGKRAKDAMKKALVHRAEEIKDFVGLSPTGEMQAALGYAEMLRDLAETIDKIPTCEVGE